MDISAESIRCREVEAYISMTNNLRGNFDEIRSGTNFLGRRCTCVYIEG